MTAAKAKARLEYLRGELEAERISYGEIAELQSLREFIEPGDVQLLEAAGVPEFLPDSIEISWHIDDVKGMEGYEDLTDDEAREVLELTANNHDATIGVNWDTLEVWADEVKSRRK